MVARSAAAATHASRWRLRSPRKAARRLDRHPAGPGRGGDRPLGGDPSGPMSAHAGRKRLDAGDAVVLDRLVVGGTCPAGPAVLELGTDLLDEAGLGRCRVVGARHPSLGYLGERRRVVGERSEARAGRRFAGRATDPDDLRSLPPAGTRSRRPRFPGVDRSVIQQDAASSQAASEPNRTSGARRGTRCTWSAHRVRRCGGRRTGTPRATLGSCHPPGGSRTPLAPRARRSCRGARSRHRCAGGAEGGREAPQPPAARRSPSRSSRQGPHARKWAAIPG